MKYLREIRATLEMSASEAYWRRHQKFISEAARVAWVSSDMHMVRQLRRWALADAGTPDMDPVLWR